MGKKKKKITIGPAQPSAGVVCEDRRALVTVMLVDRGSGCPAERDQGPKEVTQEARVGRVQDTTVVSPGEKGSAQWEKGRRKREEAGRNVLRL